jgi:VTC domain
MHFERVSGDRTDSEFPDVGAASLQTGPEGRIASGAIFQQAVSPALRSRTAGAAPAFELKFLLDEARARQVEARLRSHLRLDPHTDPALGNAYLTTTVYCETPGFDVFRGLGIHKYRKYRIRSYAAAPGVFLERKTRRRERVRKRRTPVVVGDLTRMSEDPADDWSAAWFHRQVSSRSLRPVCCVQYARTAYFEEGQEGPIRLTFDRHLHAAATTNWTPGFAAAGVPFLPNQVICEFKFRAVLPGLFKSVIEELQLVPAKVSKYRRSLEALGLAAAARDLVLPAAEDAPFA